MINLKITQDGTLLPTLFEVVNVTPTQVSIVKELFQRGQAITYDEFLTFLREHEHRVALEGDNEYIDWLAAHPANLS